MNLFGPNRLKPPKGTPLIVKIFREYFNIFGILLYIAGILCLTGIIADPSFPNWLITVGLAIVLWLVAIINGTISFVENQKSERTVKGFSKMRSSFSIVIRDGKPIEIDSTQIVVGDIVQIRAGDKTPCDMRMIEVSALKVDNSSLTGESEPIQITIEKTNENPLETRNLCFFGTSAVEGEGLGICIRTGDNTVIGQVANLAGSTSKVESPLKKEINLVVYCISVIAILMAIAFFIYGIPVVGFLNALIYAIGTIVANIPQGLIVTVTVMLTLGARRLAKKNLIVKNLESVEILGSTSVICSDKTGTITQNRMTVVNVWTDEKLIAILYDSGKKDTDDSPAYNELLNNCCLCIRTVYEGSEDNMHLPVMKRRCLGDASETALLKFYDTRPNLEKSDELRRRYTKIFEIPFNSKNKWQLSIHKDEQSNSNRVLRMKGAPERIFSICDQIFINGRCVAIDQSIKEKFDSAYKILATKGQRVLGHAIKVLDYQTHGPLFDSQYSEENVPLNNLIFIGLTGLMDPPKLGVVEAVSICKTAGVRVVMVTGDHPLTAKAIAKQVGIIEGDTVEDIAEREGLNVEEVNYNFAEAAVIEGSKIDKLSIVEWNRILNMKQVVFARTSPQQKLLIVTKYQEKGHVVSVTGDGVNDSPALKKADLGIAMNISGSDVSKEAANMILLDDNFASIVEGTKQGRLIYENIKKSIAYTVTHLIPEVIPFLVLFIFGIPLPLSAILILFIDLGTELISAVSLVYEKEEKDIMNRPPRHRDEHMFDWALFSFSYLQIGVIETLGCMFTYFMCMLHYGFTPYMLYGVSSTFFLATAPTVKVPDGRIYTAQQQVTILQEAQSAYFITLALLQNVNLFCCRVRRNSIFQQGLFTNKLVIVGVIASTLISLLVGWLNVIIFTGKVVVFNSTYLWVSWIPFAIFIFMYDEIRRFLVRNTDTGAYQPYAW